jgi:hypothetical protein
VKRMINNEMSRKVALDDGNRDEGEEPQDVL